MFSLTKILNSKQKTVFASALVVASVVGAASFSLLGSGPKTAKAADFLVGTGTSSSCTEASLKSVVASSPAGAIIGFNCGTTAHTITLSSQIDIAKNLTFDGGNLITLSGNNATRIFDVKLGVQGAGLNLMVQNMKLISGRVNGTGEEGAGGAIRTSNYAILKISNVQFSNNFANGEGGGAIYAGFRSNNTIDNATFDNNISNGNDGTPARGERGAGALAVKSESMTKVTGSTFTANKGINGAAINTVLGGLVVENSTFKNNDSSPGGPFSVAPNYTKGHGGAIYTDGASPKADGTTTGDVIIRNSRFEANKGAGQGGALFLYVYGNDRVTIADSTIINNVLVKDAKGDSIGGGLRTGNGTMNITNTVFAGNQALQQGGGMWIGGNTTVNVTKTTFINNKAVDGTNGLGGGVASTTVKPVKFTNVSVMNNIAGYEGGGIRGDSNITLQNTIVANNVANNQFGNKQNAADGKGFQSNPAPYFANSGNNVQWPAISNNFNNADLTASVIELDPQFGPFTDNLGAVQTHPCIGNPLIINSGSGLSCSVVSSSSSSSSSLSSSSLSFSLSSVSSSSVNSTNSTQIISSSSSSLSSISSLPSSSRSSLSSSSSLSPISSSSSAMLSSSSSSSIQSNISSSSISSSSSQSQSSLASVTGAEKIVYITPENIIFSPSQDQTFIYGDQDLKLAVSGDTRIQEGAICTFQLKPYPSESNPNPGFVSSSLSATTVPYTNGKCETTFAADKQFQPWWQFFVRVQNTDGRTYGADPEYAMKYGAIVEITAGAEVVN